MTWALVSGGKDSATTAHVLAARGDLEGCVFIDTGIAAPDVLSFVRVFCESNGWPLEVYRTPIAYEDLVLRYGFPGPAQHGIAMNSLKGRALRLFHKAHPEAIAASGVRTAESARRFRSARAESVMDGLKIIAPILDWSTNRVWEYVTTHGLPRSPVYGTLGISGDCLCGAFAEPIEATIIEHEYPAVAERLRELEGRVSEIRRTRIRWGGKLGPGFCEKQSRMESFICAECRPV